MLSPAGLKGHRRDGPGILADLGGPCLRFEGTSPGVLRVRFSADGAWSPRRSWAAIPEAAARPTVALDLSAVSDGIRVAGGGLEGFLDDRGRLTVRMGQREVVADGDAGGVRWQADPAGCEWVQAMPPGRRYYGFGERTGVLDKRGRRYTCWTTDEWRHQGPSTDSLYVAVPFFLATDPDGQSFGVFLDSTRRTVFDLSRLGDEQLSMKVEDRELDWYLITGPEPATVVERFTALVGRPYLPPRWALGYHQARWSYGDAAEVREVAKALRKHRIPTDAIHLDIDHMDRYRVFSWDRERFPDPPGLVSELRSMGLRTTVVVDSAVLRDRQPSWVYDDGSKRGYFVHRADGEGELVAYQWGGPSVLPDHAQRQVRRWWGSLYHGYLDAGVAGFLNDMNEPALHDLPFDDPRSANFEPPPDTPFGAAPERTTHEEVRNVYASLENWATAEGLLAAQPDKRPFLVTRAGFAGVQRHAIVWTGDNASYWEHLEMSLPQLINLGLSGIPIAGADIGGFFADCTPELLVRWTQLGSLYPFARNNSAKGTTRQEPWVWGEPTTTRCRRAIELRYRLLPYLYTLVREATLTGWPVLRPLFFHDEGEVERGVEDQALLGRDLLLAPVTRPGKACRDVWLPKGEWWDMRSGRRLAGGRTVLASASLDEEVPLFARAGSIVPMGPALQWTDEAPVDPLILHVFPTADGSASGACYEDDGTTLGWARGDWCRTDFRTHREDGVVMVRGRRDGSFSPPARVIEVILHDATSDRRVRVRDGPSWEVAVPPGAR